MLVVPLDILLCMNATIENINWPRLHIRTFYTHDKLQPGSLITHFCFSCEVPLIFRHRKEFFNVCKACDTNVLENPSVSSRFVASGYFLIFAATNKFWWTCLCLVKTLVLKSGDDTHTANLTSVVGW